MTAMIEFLNSGELPTTDFSSIIGWIINSIGHFFILKKCGAKAFCGFIPVVREYQMCGQGEGRAHTGSAYCA